ncbi:MAG: N-acetylmuramoyl-L-alanine amidase [Candidatus Omnitrophica bacterium]|nr:N-acetylmuramoyl-L-alanine amidase [Candidatus Omnitrophota bacterium]
MKFIFKISRPLIVLLFSSLLFFGCAYHAEMLKIPDVSLYNETVFFNNVQYVSLLKFCDYYNLSWDWDLVSQRIEVTAPWVAKTSLVLRPGSNFALINGRGMEFDYPIEYKDGAAYIPVKTAIFVTEDVLRLKEKPVFITKKHRIETVVIDPGHGGKDPGAISRYGTREKDVVLDISKRIKKYLEKQGINVIMTRENDTFIPLYDRAEIANKRNANFFVSIHANASRHSRAKGVEVFYLSDATDDSARVLAAIENASFKFEKEELVQDKKLSTIATLMDMKMNENRRQSKELAYYMCNIISDNLCVKKRGVKGAGFAVLKRAQMPAVLIEVGFLTNRREESNLNNSAYKEKAAEAISQSILAYKKEYERTNGFSE